ncbi:hypothetical protein C8Q76DRAFT_727182 [Earliella scabrosa]|nr:hypothetical protein C8Q76DRAFT_727182 [Earliella scabrosa]
MLLLWLVVARGGADAFRIAGLGRRCMGGSRRRRRGSTVSRRRGAQARATTRSCTLLRLRVRSPVAGKSRRWGESGSRT